MKKILAVVASIGVATLLSGCASQAVKNAVTDIRDSHLAYGSVLKVFPGDSDANKKNCAKNTSAKWTEACGNLSNLVETRIAILNSSRIVTATYMAQFRGKFKRFDIAGRSKGKWHRNEVGGPNSRGLDFSSNQPYRNG
jgi:hypothetical protein